jgi:uncharacterized protein YlxP (DUF503 family)
MGGRGQEAHLVVGVLRLEIFLPENHSLKGKRGVLRTIKARVSNKFNVSIAECADHDLWQKAVLGIAQVGSEQAHVDAALRQVLAFIEDMMLADVGAQEVEFLHYG